MLAPQFLSAVLFGRIEGHSKVDQGRPLQLDQSVVADDSQAVSWEAIIAAPSYGHYHLASFSTTQLT
jgi:hypothetical protein